MREAVSVVKVGKSSMPKFLATREPTVGARTIGDLALPYSVRICFVLKALPMAAFLLIFEMPAASGSEHDQMPEVPAPSNSLDFSQPASVGAQMAPAHATRAIDAEAQLETGRALVRGDGLEQDVERGLSLIEAAARTGSGWAWVSLGDFYSDGEYTSVDASRALDAYRSAIEFGVPSARLKIAKLFAEGTTGFPANPERALTEYQMAVDEGLSPSADVAIARGHLRGSFGQLSDPSVAVSIYERLGAAGEVDAQEEIKRDLGRALVRGDGLEQDAERGLSILLGAAKKGNSNALNDIISLLIESPPADREEFHAIFSRSGFFADVSAFAKAISKSPIDYEEIWLAFSDLQPETRLSVVTQAGRKDQNLFIGLLQAAMSEDGYYLAKFDGLIGQKTISAYRNFCQSKLDPQICRYYVLDRRARGEISQQLSAWPAP